MLLSFGIAVCLGNSRMPQFFKTLVWRLLDGHGEGAAAVVTALTSASKEALLPQIGQAPHLVAWQARLLRGIASCYSVAARAPRWLFRPPAETALTET